MERPRPGDERASGDDERRSPPAAAPRVAGARRALAESAAATAILLDRDAWAASAGGHLRDGWRALLDAEDGGRGAELPLTERMRAARLTGLARAEQEELADVLERLESAGPPSGELPPAVTRAALRRQARLLSAEAHRVLRDAGVRRPPYRWIAAGLGAVVLVALLMWAGGGRDVAGEARAQGWLGRYYPELDFGGDPVIRYDEAIDFEWLDEPPVDGIPKDRYTVRWDTCLALAADDTLQLRMGSDDGSRLFIDGERVIDNWQDQAGNWKDYTARLEAGVHHLRVEYYENGGDALAILNVSGPAGPLSPTALKPPRLSGDDVVCLE